MSRARRNLRRASLALACLVLLGGLAAPAAAEEHFLVTELAPDLLLLGTDQGSYSNNSLVFTGPEGVLLVDTHADGDADILRNYPTLRAEDLANAWAFVVANREEIERQIRENEEA